MFSKVVVAVLLCISTATALRPHNFYRRDYTYIEEYDAFYKFHPDESTWMEGFLTCDDEGAQLFYPTGDERYLAANLTESIEDLEVIYVGVRDDFGLGAFITIDGRFIPELYDKRSIDQFVNCGLMSVRTGIITPGTCDFRKPFICKKKNNEYCPTADSGYVFSKSLKKCFKINENKKTWANAKHTCIMEGGVLADSIEGVKTLPTSLRQDQSYHIGFQRMSGDRFYSSRGLHMIIGESSGDAHCTVINYEMIVLASDCDITRPFICEIEVHDNYVV